MRSATLLFVVLSLTALSGCTYEVTGECVDCAGTGHTTVSGSGCTKQAALQDAQEKCSIYERTFQETETVLSPWPPCFSDGSSLQELQLAATSAQDGLRIMANGLWGVQKRDAAKPADSCPAGGFTVKLTNNEGEVCTTEFSPQIKVKYTDVDGAAKTQGDSVSKGETVTLTMADAGSANGGISAFQILVNTTCTEDATEDQWSTLTYDSGTVEIGATLTFVLDADGFLIDTTPDPSTAQKASKAATVASQSKSNLTPRPDPKFSKKK